jgi:hypothetical protein
MATPTPFEPFRDMLHLAGAWILALRFQKLLQNYCSNTAGLSR